MNVPKKTKIIALLKLLMSITANLLSFSFFVGMLGALSAIFLIDWVKPHTLFNPYIFFFIVVALVTISLYFTLKRNAKHKNHRWFYAWSRNRKIIVTTAFISLTILVPLAVRYTSYLNDERLLERAKTQFYVEISNKALQGQIDNTLIELQRQLTTLRKEYVQQPPDYMIRVKLFVNAQELHSETSSRDWVDAYVRIIPTQPPIIYIPVEPESQRFDKTAPTSGPAHEITHVIAYEVLGLQSMDLIPRFFHEGLAQYESLKGFTNLPNRLFIRLFLLAKDPSIVLREEPLQLNSNSSQEDINYFYSLSYEFMRYLAGSYGIENMWQVVRTVGNGVAFDNAFESITGDQYLGTYSKFCRNWLSAPIISMYRD